MSQEEKKDQESQAEEEAKEDEDEVCHQLGGAQKTINPSFFPVFL